MIWKYKKKKTPEWRPWFAWKPVPIGGYPLRDGQKIVWLQIIYRKWIDCREGSNRYNYSLSPPHKKRNS